MKSKQTHKHNAIAIDGLSQKFGLSKQYIRECLRGKRTSITSEKIVQEYDILKKQIEDVVDANNGLKTY